MIKGYLLDIFLGTQEILIFLTVKKKIVSCYFIEKISQIFFSFVIIHFLLLKTGATMMFFSGRNGIKHPGHLFWRVFHKIRKSL